MELTERLRRIVDWLNEGYPSGIPPTDYVPLLALLRRRLTEEEVREVAAEIASWDTSTHTDIGVHITRITDALPGAEDIRRVEERLIARHGWPEDQDRDAISELTGEQG